MAPSTYYDTKTRPPSARAVRDAELGPVLRTLWEDNYRVYGVRKLWKAARRAGHDVGRDQVARLMRSLDIHGVRRGKPVKTTNADPAAPEAAAQAAPALDYASMAADDVFRLIGQSCSSCHARFRKGR